MSTSRVTVAGVELAYEELGDGNNPAGPPIVFLWGMFGDREQWRAVAEQVSDLGHCVLVDGAGYGESPPLNRAHTLEDYAEIFAEFLREVIGEPAILVGQSMGAMTFMRLALAHPDLVRAVALMDTSAAGEDEDRKPGYDAMLAAAEEGGVTPALLDLIAMILMSEGFRAAQPEKVEAWRDRMLGLSEHFDAFRFHARAVFDRSDVTARLADLTMPALVVVGSEDASTIPARSQSLAAAWGGNVAYVEIEGGGHFAPWEQPEPTARALRSWIASY